MRRCLPVALWALAPMLLPACGDGLSRKTCYPEPLQVSPSTAAPGDSVTLSAAAGQCGTGELNGVDYRIGFRERRGEPVEVATVSTGIGGAFSIEVTIPANAKPGPALLEVAGSAFDRCDDTGSCPGYSADVNVMP